MAEYTHELQREEEARVHLTINVPVDTVQDTYAKSIKDIQKQAHIKGFRKGKAPLSALEQKFGDAIKAEVTEKIIQAAIPPVLEKIEEKPLPYSQPTLKYDEKGNEKSSEAPALLVDPQAPFTFTISYDTTPHIEPADLSSYTLEEHSIKIDDKDIASELKDIQERNAITSEKEGAIAKGDLVSYACVTLDENKQEIEESRQQNVSTTIGSETLEGFELDEELIGLKANEEKEITKSYPDSHKDTLLAGNTLTFKVIIQKVRTKNLPDIDDELAQDVNEKYKTLDDLKKHLKTQVGERAKNTLDNLYKRQILDYLVAHSKLEVPQSAIAVQQENAWRQFVQQYGGNEQMILQGLQDSNNSKESILEQWKGDAISQVSRQLLIDHLLKTHEISLSDEEVETQLKEEMGSNAEEFDKLLEYYKSNNFMDQIKYDLEQKKLFLILQKSTIIKKGKTFSFNTLNTYIKKLDEKEQKKDGK